MMAMEFELLFFLKDAPCTVSGAAILNHKTLILKKHTILLVALVQSVADAVYPPVRMEPYESKTICSSMIFPVVFNALNVHEHVPLEPRLCMGKK